MIVRQRLIFWLIKAYWKRSRKQILIYFGVGLLVFFLLRFLLGIFSALPFEKKETIGIVGFHTIDDLPQSILSKISFGLTLAQNDGTVKPGAAYKWQVINNGKVYVFYLKPDVSFSDGANLTSNLVRYNFSDVEIDRPNKVTIVFKLKDNYSPFLITASRPIFKKGFVGVGDYKVKNIKLNGNFVESLDLVLRNGRATLSYQFYPTAMALKNAFVLGEVSKMEELSDVKFKSTAFTSFKNSAVVRKINYGKLVTLFYNTQNDLMSSKNLREGLSYAILDSFEEGLRNSTPFSPLSFAAQPGLSTYQEDLVHAKLLLDKVPLSGKSSRLSLVIDTLPRFENTAKKIAKIWQSLNVNVKVRVVDKIPQNFQIFLGEFNVSLDPDQYVLWHSDQLTNIAHYSNLRVDKLLEDGRKETDIEKRKQIYADFQKYILADPPASFLYFPYEYEVSRK